MNLSYLKMSIGTVDSPYVLTDNRLKALVYLYENNINHSLSGYVTTESDAISAYYKYCLEQLGLVVSVTTVEQDTYTLIATNSVIDEGNSTQIRCNGVSAKSLHWYIKNVSVTGVSTAFANTVKNRITISATGLLSCESPQENIGWTALVTVGSYPSYIDSSDTNAIAAAEVTCTLSVQAISVSSISISLRDYISQGESTMIEAVAYPASSTKTISSITLSCLTGSISGYTYTSGQTATQDTITAQAEVLGDYVVSTYTFTMSLVVFSPTKNKVLWTAMLASYPDMFGDEGRESIKSEEIAEITDITALCSYLKALTADDIKAIDGNSIFSFDEFQYFTGVTSLPISTVVTDTGCMAQSRISSIIFPPNITSITGVEASMTGSVSTAGVDAYLGAFAGCLYLVKVDFGTGVKTITGGCAPTYNNSAKGYKMYSGAFSGCTSLTTIIWGNVESVGFGGARGQNINYPWYSYWYTGAFSGCTALKLTTLGNIKQLGVAYTGYMSQWAGEATYANAYFCAFSHSDITEVDFSNIEAFGESVFCGYQKTYLDLSTATKITEIPANLPWFGGGVLKTVLLPNSSMRFTGNCGETSTIFYKNNYNTEGTLITLPTAQITSIASYWTNMAYGGRGLYLPYLYVPNKTLVCTAGTYTFATIYNGNYYVHVPYVIVNDNLVDKYKASSSWSTYQSICDTYYGDTDHGIISETLGKSYGLIS